MSTIRETVKEWLATDTTGKLIADKFEEIVIREAELEGAKIPQIYIFIKKLDFWIKRGYYIMVN